MKIYYKSIKINQNPNWYYIPDHRYRILLVGGSRSGKTNMVLNLTKNQGLRFDKTYLHVKDSFESKYQIAY